MALPDHPVVANVLDHLRAAGARGLRAAFLVDLIDGVRPPGFFLLQQLLDAGLVVVSPAPLTIGSTVVLSKAGEEALDAAVRAGAKFCRIEVVRRTVLTEADVVAFLFAVEQGTVTLEPEADPGRVYAGVVEYTASNGWRLGVFNDCNEWDYIEWIEAGDERITLDDIERDMPAVTRYQPSAEIAERAYRIPGSKGVNRRAEQLEADERAFDELREVLRGARRVSLDAGSSKALRIMLERGATDSEITRERFAVHRGPQRGRRGCEYERRLAPAVVSELLVRAGLDMVSESVVIGLPAGRVGHTPGFPEWSHEARLVWIAPADDVVKILFRDSPDSWQAPFVQKVPADGPLAMRELPAWAPRREYRELDAPLPCPHCGGESTRYRASQGALVCEQCGRSFVC